MEEEYKKYVRKGHTEAVEWTKGMDMSNVSISAADKEVGSPKTGDMIARNPLNHNDKWLIAKKYFQENLVELN